MPEGLPRGDGSSRRIVTDIFRGHDRISVVSEDTFNAVVGGAMSRAIGAETTKMAGEDAEICVPVDDGALRRIVARMLDELHGEMARPETSPDLRTAAKMVEHVLPMLRERRDALLEERLQKLTDAFLDMQGGGGPVFTEDMILENARLRAQFLSEWRVLKSGEIADMAGHRAKNAAATASRWRSRKLVFAISTVDGLLYPEFQFHHGEPHPAIAKVLAKLPEAMSEWEIAFWFVSPNGYLDGRRPADALVDLQAVEGAAAYEAQGWAG